MARKAEDGRPAVFPYAAVAQSTQMFKGWRDQERRRQSLLGDLLDLVSAHAFRKFGVVVQSAAASDLSGTFNHDMPAIEVAARIVALEVEIWRTSEKFKNRPEHIFEDGDVGKGKVLEAVKFINGGIEPLFRPKKDNPDKGIVGFTPLQAADILAFEVKKAANDAFLANGQIPKGYVFRFPWIQLRQIAERSISGMSVRLPMLT